MVAPVSTGSPADPRRLVVLVPGFNGHSSLWVELRQRLEGEPGYSPQEAHWLAFDHGTGKASMGSLEDLARRLNGRIVAEWLRFGGFEEVVLVGHSMGGLLVRQAYLLGAGAIPGEAPRDWARRVIRIVLLASINRGIEAKRVKGLPFVAWLARIVPFFPRLRLLGALRGAGFLTNLRIHWIRFFGALGKAQREGETWADGTPKKAPLVVQLLGSEDGLVEQADSKDVLAFRGGHYLEVPDADHRSVYRLDLAPDPDLRYAVLRQGFLGDFSARPAADDDAADDPIERVVFLMHGIRASNVDSWIKGLKDLLAARDPVHTEVRQPTYGYFTAARFALPSVRRRNVHYFQDWYTEALAEHPNAEFDVIAHSNGTYLVGASLLETPGMQFSNVALAGSVLPGKFPWEDLKRRKQVGRVQNHRANRDWPVALLCSGLRGLRMNDVGTAGFAGFVGDETSEIAYFSGGHGEALRPSNHRALVDFVFGGKETKPTDLQDSPGYFRQLSNLMPYATSLTVLAILAAVVWLLFQGWWAPVLWSALAALVVYVILDII